MYIVLKRNRYNCVRASSSGIFEAVARCGVNDLRILGHGRLHALDRQPMSFSNIYIYLH